MQKVQASKSNGWKDSCNCEKIYCAQDPSQWPDGCSHQSCIDTSVQGVKIGWFQSATVNDGCLMTSQVNFWCNTMHRCSKSTICVWVRQQESDFFTAEIDAPFLQCVKACFPKKIHHFAELVWPWDPWAWDTGSGMQGFSRLAWPQTRWGGDTAWYMMVSQKNENISTQIKTSFGSSMCCTLNHIVSFRISIFLKVRI